MQKLMQEVDKILRKLSFWQTWRLQVGPLHSDVAKPIEVRWGKVRWDWPILNHNGGKVPMESNWNTVKSLKYACDFIKSLSKLCNPTVYYINWFSNKSNALCYLIVDCLVCSIRNIPTHSVLKSILNEHSYFHSLRDYLLHIHTTELNWSTKIEKVSQENAQAKYFFRFGFNPFTLFKDNSLCQFYFPGLFSLFLIHT